MGKSPKVEVPLSAANALITTVGNTIRTHYEATQQELPNIVSISRTGLHIGPVIARAWGMDTQGMYTAALAKKDPGAFEYVQMPTPAMVGGKDLVVIDGVCKSGETLKHVVDLLQMAGAASVKSAVLIHKPDETTTDYDPDFQGEIDRHGAFYVFPWERDEFLPKPTVPMVSFPGIGPIPESQVADGVLPHGA